MICPKTMFIHYLPGGSLNLDHKKIMMTYKSIRTLRVFKCNSSALIEWIFPSCATLNWIIGNSRKKTPSISNLFALNHSFIRFWPKKNNYNLTIVSRFYVFSFLFVIKFVWMCFLRCNNTHFFSNIHRFLFHRLCSFQDGIFSFHLLSCFVF